MSRRSSGRRRSAILVQMPSRSGPLLHQLEVLCCARQFAAALALARSHSPSAEEGFYLALAAFAAGELGQALALVERAVQLAPDDRVFAAASVYLRSVLERGKRAVYVQPAAFSAFIRGGSNLQLYHATSAALSAVYAERERMTLLDIGVGDGMALLPALSPHVAHVIALEPSRPMLQKAASALGERGVSFEAVPATIQQYMQHTLALRCELAQATFSLQSLPPAQRARVWPWLREAVGRVLLVEFDVPSASSVLAARWVEHVLERYRHGLAEHASEPLVVQGFLMPVMFGYFDPTAARTNFEQPRSAWIAELQSAGFGQVRSQLLYDYWWAPAYLFDAR